ncbi:hypothetical protein [Streptomyces tauricus]|uniref:hypothetical protein n=1 Tax=Streptomyces tauricus TaxID=68274 RepID=UPI0022448670|nr:hypothetical protein [Streptomyces tauricus]MCW8103310.1 hypothetical protein [Streptomyces tauricus]
MFQQQPNKVKPVNGEVGDSASYYAFISADGTPAVNGENLPRATGEPAQTAVLDRLFSSAREQERPVIASVLDHEQRIALRVMVRPDGSSRILEPPRTIDVEDPWSPAENSSRTSQFQLRSEQAKRVDVSTGHATDPAENKVQYMDPDTAILRIADVTGNRLSNARESSVGGATSVVFSQTAGKHNMLSAEADTPTAPAHVPVSVPVAVPVAAPVPASALAARDVVSGIPPELTDTINLIRKAVAERRFPSANHGVAELKRVTSDLFGAEHPHMFEALALEAYVAHLEGDHERSTAVSLNLAERRFTVGDNRAEEEIERAAATWDLLRQPNSIVPLGRELVSVWALILGAKENDSAGMEAVKSRLARFARVSVPRFATSLDAFRN